MLANVASNGNGDPAGRSWIAVDGPVSRTRQIETGDADREANMWRFTESALELLAECLREASA